MHTTMDFSCVRIFCSVLDSTDMLWVCCARIIPCAGILNYIHVQHIAEFHTEWKIRMQVKSVVASYCLVSQLAQNKYPVKLRNSVSLFLGLKN